MNPGAPAVYLEDVSYRIGRHIILNGINFRIGKGCIHGILGPNGSGKTSILSIVLGLRRHTGGTVSVPERARIGAVLQETSLYEELTAYENLLFSASLYGIKNEKKRISEVLEILGLGDRSGDIVRNLSGGMRRRITIARALLHKPELLVIDEPTLGVDEQARQTIWSYLRNLKNEGLTILAATNYIDEVQALCNTVSVISSGRLIMTDEPGKIFERAGCRVDIECSAEASDRIRSISVGGVNRSKITPEGVSILIKDGTPPEKLVLEIMKNTPVAGFRIRPPDLSEVFRMLEGM